MTSDIEIGFRNTWAVENMCSQVPGPAHENDKADGGAKRWGWDRLCVLTSDQPLSWRLMGREQTMILILLFIIAFQREDLNKVWIMMCKGKARVLW